LCCRRTETLHQLESSHTGGGFQVERRALIGKEAGRVSLTVREAGAHERTRAAAQPWPIHVGAVREQKLKKRALYAGLLRMNTGGNKTERRATAVVNIRAGIHVGARAKQQLADFDNVLRCLLTVPFDAIRRNVVKQRGAMFATRTHAHQPGIAAKQTSEIRDISCDNRFYRRFKLRLRGIRVSLIENMSCELVPTRKSVRARNDKLGIGQFASLLKIRSCEVRNITDPAIDAHRKRRRYLDAGSLDQLRDPICGPVANADKLKSIGRNALI
jgi:hypothetical protein